MFLFKLTNKSKLLSSKKSIPINVGILVALFSFSCPSFLILGTSATRKGISKLFGLPFESLIEKANLFINSIGVLPFPNPVNGVVLWSLVNGMFSFIASPAEIIVLGEPVSITASILPKDLSCLEKKGRTILIKPSIFLISKLNLILIKNNFTLIWDILYKNSTSINSFFLNII